jgi:hypothetical protein
MYSSIPYSRYRVQHTGHFVTRIVSSPSPKNTRTHSFTGGYESTYILSYSYNGMYALCVRVRTCTVFIKQSERLTDCVRAGSGDGVPEPREDFKKIQKRFSVTESPWPPTNLRRSSDNAKSIVDQYNQVKLQATCVPKPLWQ